MTQAHPTKTPKSVDIVVGTNIRNIRNVKRISQTDLGNAVGVTFQQIQKYEKGMNRVSASMLADIAKALGCELMDLFNGALDASNIKTSSVPLPTRAASQLAELYDSIDNPRIQAAIRKAVDGIVEAYTATQEPNTTATRPDLAVVRN